MVAYAYYLREDQRHADLVRHVVSQEQLVEAAQALFRHWKVGPIEVRFHEPVSGRKKYSWYQPALGTRRKNKPVKYISEHISILTSMCNYLTLAHEFAHYIHHHEYRNRRVEHERRQLMRAGRLETPLRRERWHGPEHLAITDAAVEFLRDAGYHPRPPTPWQALAVATRLLAGRRPEELTAEARRILVKELLANWMKMQPTTWRCSCCGADLPRERFGARVMTSDPQGVPTLVRRQPRCVSCRSGKKS